MFSIFPPKWPQARTQSVKKGPLAAAGVSTWHKDISNQLGSHAERLTSNFRQNMETSCRTEHARRPRKNKPKREEKNISCFQGYKSHQFDWTEATWIWRVRVTDSNSLWCAQRVCTCAALLYVRTEGSRSQQPSQGLCINSPERWGGSKRRSADGESSRVTTTDRHMWTALRRTSARLPRRPEANT